MTTSATLSHTVDFFGVSPFFSEMALMSLDGDAQSSSRSRVDTTSSDQANETSDPQSARSASEHEYDLLFILSQWSVHAAFSQELLLSSNNTLLNESTRYILSLHQHCDDYRYSVSSFYHYKKTR